MGTFADTYSLRTALANLNGVANAVDGSLSTHWGATTGGTSAAYTLSPSPAWTTDTRTGVRYIFFTPHVTNPGAATLSPSGLAPASMTYKNAALVGGELVQNVEAVVAWDGTNYELLTHGGGWATWTPTYGATSPMTFTGVTTNLADYQRHGSNVFFRLNASGTLGGTASTGIQFTLPINASGSSSSFSGFVDRSVVLTCVAFTTGVNTVELRRESAANFMLGAASVFCSGFYKV